MSQINIFFQPINAKSNNERALKTVCILQK